MSSVSNGKRKLTQNDLRRFMSEQKKKLLNETKIDSPLAKYRSDGQLMCIVCNSIVRNEKIWKVHINGKQHKENLLTIKEGGVPSAQVVPNISTKRSLSDETLLPTPQKKIKGILKNAPKPELPKGFFDSPSTTVNNVKISNKTVNPLEQLQSSNNEVREVNDNDETAEMEEDKPKGNSDIPEGFFDDPVLDAKARNVEYKDPIQDEWERFQKEIKEENTVSDQIIEVDQEEAIAERQIDEIDEQLRNWSRVLDLEVKKEKVQAEISKGVEDMDQDTASDDEGDFDEFLDWRAKRSFR